MERIIECVPNFSEGRIMHIIEDIVQIMESSAEIKILNIDPGAGTNRTVVTFVGSPEEVVEAAFQGVKRASELIDMSKHSGTHPRSGATDVLPLIPISGISLKECAVLARNLAKRISEELDVPCYCYEAAALRPERKNLAVCRKGGYEALPQKILNEDTRPDFVPIPATAMMTRAGATNVGARDFLVAVNFNLDTTCTEIASAIAADVREAGRMAPDGSRIPGSLKGCKALGWYIDEYGIAQVTMNITDINATPLHLAFEEVCRAAKARGIRVTGTEIIGLLPKRCLIEAGKYYFNADGHSSEVKEKEIIDLAIKKMGLNDLTPFNSQKRIIEYLLES